MPEQRTSARTRRVAATVAAVTAVLAISCSGGDDGSPEFCALWSDYLTSTAAVLSDREAPQDRNAEVREIVAGASDSVPDELAEPWDVILDSQNDFVEAREEAGIDPNDEESFEDFDTIAILDEATTTIDEWANDNCDSVTPV